MRAIEVSNHAVHRYRVRFREPDLPTKTIRPLLANIVKEAREDKTITSGKPIEFRLFGETGQLPPGQSFCPSRDGKVGLILAREDACDTVLTTLSRAASVELNPGKLRHQGAA